MTRLPNGRFVVGPGVMALAAHYDEHFRAVVQPVLDDLSQAIGLNCSLVVQEGKSAVVIAEAGPRNVSLLLSYRTGADIPLDRGSVGYALAACRPPVEGEPVQVTLARSNQVALSDGEVIPGSYGAAAAIRRLDGHPACIHIFSLNEQHLQEATPHIRDAAGRLNSMLSPG